MLHRSLRTLRQPFAWLAVLVMLLGAISPALASPAASTVPETVAQDDATAVIALTAYTCEPGALPTGTTLPAAEMGTICPTPAPNIEFHLQQGDADTILPTDAQGNVRFEFPAGETVKFFAGVPLEADEALYCVSGEASDGEFTAVTIDNTGVSTFDTTTASQFTCFWYVGAEPNQEPTEIPVTETPTTSSLDLFTFDCAADAVSDVATASYDDLVAACSAKPAGVEFRLETGNDTQDETTDQDGQAEFSYPAGGDVDFYAVVPIESVEVLYCSVSLGTPERLDRDDQGVFHWANAEVEQRTCSWFLVAPGADPTEIPATDVPTEIPTEIPATEVPTEVPATEIPAELGQIAISPVTCPDSFDPATSGTDLATLAANCTEPVSSVSFTLGDGVGWSDVRVSSATEPIVWSGLHPGSYTLVSSVPLESAREYLGCQADDGDLYQKEFTAQGVTTFVDLESEQIDCTWYIVPENNRGDETGSSLEIHLAACPAGFSGSNPFETCHSNGLAGYDFTIEGPDGTQTAATAILQQDGPGVVTFASLPAGDYTVMGGPPGDFGHVDLYCSTQPDNGEPDYSIDGVIGTVVLGENQHVLCDWYYIPDDNGSPTVTPTPTTTPEPTRAEILVTLLACPAGDSGSYSGSSLAQLEQQCTEKVNDVTFRLGAANGVPLSAKTGVSGDGGVRFYDLLPGDLTMTPSLPSTLRNLAVFCTIGDGDPYQKALSNGGTTFVDVDGESIACSWFAVKTGGNTGGGDTGSITVREYLCEKDRSQITDWDAECTPGSTGSTFTVANTSNGEAKTGTPNNDGIYVFSGLPDGHYTLTQGTGQWCRAVADRVDNQSRVIVQGGGNTDVVLYQCNAIDNLPVTGSGDAQLALPGKDGAGLPLAPLTLLGSALPLAGLAAWRMVQRRAGDPAPVIVLGHTEAAGRWWHRYR